MHFSEFLYVANISYFFFFVMGYEEIKDADYNLFEIIS